MKSPIPNSTPESGVPPFTVEPSNPTALYFRELCLSCFASSAAILRNMPLLPGSNHSGYSITVLGLLEDRLLPLSLPVLLTASHVWVCFINWIAARIRFAHRIVGPLKWLVTGSCSMY